jgi:hypothetical protein
MADDDESENVPGNHLTRQLRKPRRNVEDDNKSHMSELTEERTQKQFDAAMMLYSANPQLRAAMAGSPRVGPPGVIGIVEETGSGSGAGAPSSSAGKLDTIASSSRGSQRPPNGRGRNPMSNESPSRRRPSVGRRDVSNERLALDTSDLSIGSPGTGKKLSVAQRARMEADRTSTPVRVRPNETPVRGNKNNSSRDAVSVNSQQSGGFFSVFGRRLEKAVDNSLLGVDMSDEGSTGSNSYEGYESSRYASSNVTTDVDGGSDYEEEKKMPDADQVSQTLEGVSFRTEQLQFQFRNFFPSLTLSFGSFLVLS